MAFCRFCKIEFQHHPISSHATECTDVYKCRDRMADSRRALDEAYDTALRIRFAAEQRRDELQSTLDHLRALAKTAADAQAVWDGHRVQCDEKCDRWAVGLDYLRCDIGDALFAADKDASHAVVEALLKGGA